MSAGRHAAPARALERARDGAAAPRRGHGGVGILVYNIDCAGGMERQAARLAEQLSRCGRRVAVISTGDPLAALRAGRPLRLVERRARTVVYYRLPFLSIGDYGTWQELYETLAAWIVHRHAWIDTLYAVQAPTAGLHAARIAPVVERPVVVKLASSGNFGDLATIERAGDARARRALLRRVERVVALNDESRDEALAAGVMPERLATIPNGIDLHRFDASTAPAALPELGPAEGREVVLFVGRLDHQKRPDVLLEAFARLAHRRAGARLAMVGDGPNKGALERLARERGLAPSRVAFLGVRDDVPAILRAASVLALPSAQEGTSNVLLEALAARVPVVASDIAGNRGVVAHEREALLVPVDDAPALATALERILGDPALAWRLAAAGRARVESAHAIEEVALRYLDLFDALPRRPPPSSLRFVLRYLASDLTGPAWMVVRGLARIARGLARRFGRAARGAGRHGAVLARALVGSGVPRR